MANSVYMKGFSLIEFMLVVALVGVVSVITFPMSLSLYNSQIFSDAHNGLIDSLRVAHSYALTQKNDTSHGVKIFEDYYVVFEGVSYVARDQEMDVSVSLSDTISFSGLHEVVFDQFTGYVNESSDIVLADAYQQATITVSQIGVIE